MVIHLSGDGRFPDHQHADSIAQLFPGASAVLLSNRGSRDPAAGAPNPSQSHRQTRQHTQVLQHKVCVCVCMFVCIYCGAVLQWQSMLIVVSSFYAASSQTSLCSSSKSTSVPDRTTCSWKRFLNFEHMNIYVFLMSNLSDSSSILLVRSTRSMASSCIDTYTWAVRSRAAVGSTTRPSSLCWVFSAWSWPTKRWWWTSFVWHSPCRYWCS